MCLNNLSGMKIMRKLAAPAATGTEYLTVATKHHLLCNIVSLRENVT